MNKRFLGAILILTGLCKLSLEIYGLKFLQIFDKIEGMQCDPWNYLLYESPVIVSFLITLCILIAGLVLISRKE